MGVDDDDDDDDDEEREERRRSEAEEGERKVEGTERITKSGERGVSYYYATYAAIQTYTALQSYTTSWHMLLYQHMLLCNIICKILKRSYLGLQAIPKCQYLQSH